MNYKELQKFISRMKRAGINGKKLNDYIRLTKLCGPYFIFKNVVKHEQNLK